MITSLVSAERHRAAAVALAHLLGPRGIELLAFKGLHFVGVLGVEPWDRPSADADVLVLRGRFRDALRIIRQSGEWEERTDDWTATALLRRACGSSVDLHRSVLPVCVGGLSRERLSARSRPGPPGLAPMRVPSVEDAAAICLAHEAKNRLSKLARTARDLRVLAAHGLTPSALGDRLRACRLRQCGIVVLTALSADDQSFVPWLAALAPIPGELRAAQRTRAAFARHEGESARTMIAHRAIADSVPESIAAVLGALVLRTPYVLSRRALDRLIL